MSTSQAELILARIEDLHGEIAEIKREVKATNGNVRALQIWRAKIEGAMWLAGRAPVFAAVLASVAAVVTAVIAATH